MKSGGMAGTVLNDANNQAKATFELAKNLADGKDAAAGTNWKIDNKIVRVPYVGVDKDNLSQFAGNNRDVSWGVGYHARLFLIQNQTPAGASAPDGACMNAARYNYGQQ